MNKTRRVILDLMDVFLIAMLEKEVWKRQDIENEFYKAMYVIAVDYLSDDYVAELAKKHKEMGLL